MKHQPNQTKPNLANQAHGTKPTKPKLLVKAVNAQVHSAFGNVLFELSTLQNWSRGKISFCTLHSQFYLTKQLVICKSILRIQISHLYSDQYWLQSKFGRFTVAGLMLCLSLKVICQSISIQMPSARAQQIQRNVEISQV